MKDFKINRGIELMLRGAKKKEAEEEPAPKGKGFAITKFFPTKAKSLLQLRTLVGQASKLVRSEPWHKQQSCTFQQQFRLFFSASV